MTKKERKDYIKEMVIDQMEEMIGGTQKELVSKNKKLLKEFLANDLQVCLLTINYVKDSYYSWEIDSQDIEINKNFDRLIYLLNENLESCSESLSEERETVKDYGYNPKITKEIEDYRELEKKVGLI